MGQFQFFLVFPDGKSTDNDARDSTSMEEDVTKFHDQVRTTSADSIEQDRCKLNSI